jgi:hypothetical protein
MGLIIYEASVYCRYSVRKWRGGCASLSLVKCIIDDWYYFFLACQDADFMLSYPRYRIRTWVSQAPRMMDTTGQINAHALVVNRDAYVRGA